MKPQAFPRKSIYLGQVIFWCFNLALVASLIAAGHAIRDQKKLSQISFEARRMPWPTMKPTMSQASIDMALKNFGITVPSGVKHPTLDLAMADRGLTTMYGSDQQLEVTIGPSAFSSWGILGSTLAHELEIHCQQNFAWIRLMDMLGMQGTAHAERAAYQYEIDQAQRFGLSRTEASSINDTMVAFYPEDPDNANASTLSEFLGSTMPRFIAK